MATFIDQRDDEELEEDVESLEEQEEGQEEVESEAVEDSQAEEEIPEKYRNKSIKDIVRMHQEAEKAMGRQSQEVGELRRTFDEYIKTQLDKEKQAHTSTPAEEIDFFEDPQKAVEYAINNHPKIKEAETVSQQMRMQESIARLRSAHPDFETIIQDEKFLGWVTDSKVRTDLLRKADREYDFDSAHELLSTWKERQNIVSQTASAEKQERKKQLKAASTGNTKGSAEAPSRKIYRRADIIKLMQTDPDRYMQLAEEIRNAYAEGRVKQY